MMTAMKENDSVEAKMTLRELVTKVGNTKDLDVPSMKKLLETGKPVDAYEADDYRIIVYPCGFALVVSGKRYTVVRVDRCRDYVYTHEDVTIDKPEFVEATVIDYYEFLDQPWPLRIMLEAEDQLWANEEHREHGWLSRHPEIPDDKNWMCGRHSGFEEAVVNRIMLEELLETLTDKQYEVYQLYFRQGYTTYETGRMLGVSQAAIGKHLKAIKKKISK